MSYITRKRAAVCLRTCRGVFGLWRRRGAAELSRRGSWEALAQHELRIQSPNHHCFCPAATLLPDFAEYIVSHVTGTRLSLLNSVTAAHSTMAGVKAWEETLHLKTQAALEAHDVGVGHALLGRMLGAPGQKLNSAQLRHEVGLTVQQRDALVKANVLAAHTDETFTCAARHVVEAFKALREAAPDTAAPAAAR